VSGPADQIALLDRYIRDRYGDCLRVTYAAARETWIRTGDPAALAEMIERVSLED